MISKKRSLNTYYSMFFLQSNILQGTNFHVNQNIVSAFQYAIHDMIYSKMHTSYTYLLFKSLTAHFCLQSSLTNVSKSTFALSSCYSEHIQRKLLTCEKKYNKWISMADHDTTCNYNLLLVLNVFPVKESTISRTSYTYDYHPDVYSILYV